MRERLGGEEQQGRVASVFDDAGDDRRLVAERLARRGAGRDDHRAPVAQSVDRERLMRVQVEDAARGEPFPHLAVQRFGGLAVAGRSLGQDLAVHAAADELRIGRELVEGGPRVGIGVALAPEWHPCEGTDRVRRRSRPRAEILTNSCRSCQRREPRTPTTVGGVVALISGGLRRRRRRGSRRRGRPRRAEPEAAAAGVRHGDVLDLVRVERERHPTEVVEVLQADAVELRVAAQQREQLELARCTLHLRPELAHRVQDQDPLVVRADDVAGREVVAVAREGERLASRHVLLARTEVRAGERVVHLGRDVHVDAADPVDEADEAGEVDVDDVRDLHADQPADGVRLRARTVRVARVDLVAGPARVARDVEHRCLVLGRVHAEHVERVAPRTADAGTRVVADQQDEERRGGRAADSIGGRERCELLDAEVGGAGRERYVHASEPRDEDGHAAEHDRGGRTRAREERALGAPAEASPGAPRRLLVRALRRVVDLRPVHRGVAHGVVPPLAVVVVEPVALVRTARARYALTRHALPTLVNVSSTWRLMVSGPAAVPLIVRSKTVAT